MFETQIGPHGAAVLALLNAKPGERVLDVGCGFGSTSLDVAAAVGSTGSVCGVDISGAMIERARARAEEASVDHVEFVVGDAQTDDLAGGRPFDAVVSRFGVMFFDDPTQAFTNIGHAVRAGGRLAIVCWQGASGNSFFALGPSLIRPALTDPPPKPDPTAPGPLALADRDRLTGLLHASGWSDIEITPLTAPFRIPGDEDDAVEACLGQLTDSELGRLAETQLTPERHEALLEQIRTELAESRVGADLVFESNVWLVGATRA